MKCLFVCRTDTVMYIYFYMFQLTVYQISNRKGIGQPIRRRVIKDFMWTRAFAVEGQYDDEKACMSTVWSSTTKISPPAGSG